MKIGKIEISESFFKEQYIDTLGLIFSKAIPIHIEKMAMTRIYTCISNEFEDIETELAIPYYECTVIDNNIKFKKA